MLTYMPVLILIFSILVYCFLVRKNVGHNPISWFYNSSITICKLKNTVLEHPFSKSACLKLLKQKVVSLESWTWCRILSFSSLDCRLRDEHNCWGLFCKWVISYQGHGSKMIENQALRSGNSPSAFSEISKGHRLLIYWLCRNNNVQERLCSELECDNLLSNAKDGQEPLVNLHH
jgi:hypothetical protein